MQNKSVKNLVIFKAMLLCVLNIFPSAPRFYDLTIVGHCDFQDGIGRLPISIVDMFNTYLKINLIEIYPELIPVTNLGSAKMANVLTKLIESSKNLPSKVTISTHFLSKFDLNLIPENSEVKIAISMIESSLIPKEWISILNEKFDAVIVPDEFLINVYRNSGVAIPIFVLPPPLYLDDFLSKPLKARPEKTFIFGMISGYWAHKNHILVVEAFAKEFKNNENVKLIMWGRGVHPGVVEKLRSRINELALNNVYLYVGLKNQEEYVEFLSSLDCNLLVSKGEGFSIGPREALALGIPNILSYNTAHMTICDTNLIECVKTFPEVNYDQFFERWAEYESCTIEDLSIAMRKMVNNYDYYLSKAAKGREWVKQYTLDNLKLKYLNLIKPQKIILGDKNEVTHDYLMTNSRELYNKYLNLY